MNEREARDLVRFLKRLPPEGADIAPKVNGTVVSLVCAAGHLTVDAATLLLGAQRGLIARKGRRIMALPEASSFLLREAAFAKVDHAVQHRDIAFESRMVEGVEQAVCVNRLESPLSMLERLKEKDGQVYFPREAVVAGERLHADFTRGALQPRVTMRFEPRLDQAVKGGRGGTADISDTALAARLRVSKAIEAVGPELAGVALDVCCFMKGLETVERERRWPVRSAKLMLRTALLALHRHYYPPAKSKSRHWGEEGYRPALQP